MSFTQAALASARAAARSATVPAAPANGDVFSTAGGLAFQWDDAYGETPLPPTVLLVDELEINRRLLKAMLKTTAYRFIEAKRASEALAILETEKVDLIVLDLMMPEMSGPEFCRCIKTNRKTQLVPILMVTSVQGIENEISGIDAGADEYLTKPLHPQVVRTRIRAMLRNKAAIDSLEEAETILFALAQAVESRDQYTGGHCQRLANYSVAMGMALGLPKRDQLALYRGGYLHDIGKIAIPDKILHGTDLLSDEEWTVMRMHTLKGEDICRPMKSLRNVLPIIRSHHEKWDGSGYPDGLSGDNIPLLARILQVVDIYDALTTARTYKPALTHEAAVKILADEAAHGWRDPEDVSLFISLSNNEIKRFEIDSIREREWRELQPMQVSLQNMNTQIERRGASGD